VSLVPEIIIQRVLVDGIRQVRSNAWRSDQLFKSVPQSFAQGFSDLLKKTPIDITIGYPREDSQFPCIAILLRAEEETDIVLGDLLSAGYTDNSGLIGSGEFFFTEGEATSDAAYGSEFSVGDPRRIFDRGSRTYKEVRGSGQSSSYLVQIMTDDQEFTIFLYHVVRFIILSSVQMLTDNGIHQLRLSGTDFLPQAAQQPNFVFMRGINMNFLYFAEYFAVEGDPTVESIAKAFVIDMGGTNKKEFGVLSQTQQPHITSVSPVTVSAGDTISVTLSGINLDHKLSISFIKSASESDETISFDILGMATYFTVSNIKLADVTAIDPPTLSPSNMYSPDPYPEPAFWSGPGSSSSTSTVYNTSDTVPSDLSEGMFVRVLGPESHAAYKEQRRIASFSSGAGGSITVVNKFSGSLNGASIQVVKYSSQVSFDLAVSSDTPKGAWDTKVTNPDLISSTLNNSFTVT
jgi:hypothetical protein